jgi:hypothetical protein
MVESMAGQARELPVDAKVFCTDGEVGRLTDVIVNPGTSALVLLNRRSS